MKRRFRTESAFGIVGFLILLTLACVEPNKRAQTINSEGSSGSLDGPLIDRVMIKSLPIMTRFAAVVLEVKLYEPRADLGACGVVVLQREKHEKFCVVSFNTSDSDLA